MKHTKILSIVCLTLFAIMAIISTAPATWANEFVLEAEVQSVTVKPDKNGNEFVRFIVLEPKTFNGIAYKAEIVTTAFGAEKVAAGQEYKPGDTIKAIARSSEYQGNTYYNVLQFIK
jgi:hypothetical protein